MINFNKNRFLLALVAIVASGFLFSFFTADGVFACSVTNCVSKNVGMGDSVDLTITAKDEEGSIIVNTSSSYSWVIVPALPGKIGLGVIAQSGGQTWNTSNSLGFSRATLQTAANAESGEVTVRVSYGSDYLDAGFDITTKCLRDPRLYYGIAEAKDSAGVVDWQKSTAEVMETCHPEYKLYEGTGEGKLE